MYTKRNSHILHYFFMRQIDERRNDIKTTKYIYFQCLNTKYIQQRVVNYILVEMTSLNNNNN